MTMLFAKVFAAFTLPISAIAIAFKTPLQSSNEFSDELDKRLTIFRGEARA